MIGHEIQELIDGLEAAQADVFSAIHGVGEEEAHMIPAPGEWTVAQLLAHIAEIQSFWMGKAVLITREDDPNVSRSEVENDIRVAAVTDHSSDPLERLVRELAEANSDTLQSLGGLSLHDLGRPGHRGEGNPITAKEVVQSLTKHVQEHARQITESLRLIRERG